MNSGLGYPPSQTTPPPDLRFKNVYKAPKRLGFRGLDTSALGFLGSGFQRERLLKNFKQQALSAVSAADARTKAEDLGLIDLKIEAIGAARDLHAADDALASLFVGAPVGMPDFVVRPMSPAESDAWAKQDSADLDREEEGKPHDHRRFRALPVTRERCEKNPALVAKLLPPALAAFMSDMDTVRQCVVGRAIMKKVEWETLQRLGWQPSEIRQQAEKDAKAYADQFPKEDKDKNPINTESEHRKRRDAKTWRREMKKSIQQARTYIALAVGAVGGPDDGVRPLYVADYSILCARADARDSHEHMERLRIVRKAKPTEQIKMLDAHRSKKQREMTKRRLVSDVHLHRANAINAKAIWITTTLPGKFHPNPTNKGREAEKWDTNLGPAEAMAEIQERHHQTLALLQKKDSKPWGMWDAQAQQDGTPHRHLLAFEHDHTVAEADIRWLADADTPEDQKEQFLADSEARVTRAARGVADAFWERFSSVAPEKRQEEMRRDDHGCAAYVVGDSDERYAPPTSKQGTEETAESIVKYMSRYSSRLATGMGDDLEQEYYILDDDTPADDTERHGVWAKERNARLHNLIGIDTPRAAQRIWDCIYKAAERGEIIDDPRMNLAVEQMRTARELIAKIPELRNETEVLETRVQQMKDALPGDLATMELTAKASRDRLKALAKEATEHAYQAAISMGFWPEQDLHASERLWLRNALELADDAGIPLPPLPLRKERENAFGEAVTETVGIAAPVVVRIGDGECISVEPSKKSTQQILLKADEWVIVDKETAARMVKKKQEQTAAEDCGDNVDDREAERRTKQAAYRDECERQDAETAETFRTGFNQFTNQGLSSDDRWARNRKACLFLKQRHGDNWKEHWDRFNWEDPEWLVFVTTCEDPQIAEDALKRAKESVLEGGQKGVVADIPTDPRLRASPAPLVVTWPPGYRERHHKNGNSGQK